MYKLSFNIVLPNHGTISSECLYIQVKFRNMYRSRQVQRDNLMPRWNSNPEQADTRLRANLETIFYISN